ncbi:DUF1249 domain-containing protein [Alteromonas aestuariivivens]|uniref:DUF1249 domain-containing protein n=1 Tax=Alteromonas aestuariivivens TaxID=1938339 RepID=A0A3D8MCF8_9ALTE|nr:DUF1249 domain-containing protein [Alteromonas aestuariivivens]RDV27975.1 DUF1249 domain-containing protein [Alteromonas aestuariivivens]
MQAICELNYHRFLRILPDCDTEDLTYQFTVGPQLSYRMTITDAARYTTTVRVEQISRHAPAYMKPVMVVRLYHDARMAEVISSQNTGAFAASYEYPNNKMRQRNEKQMVNVFLAEWLQFCLKQRPEVVTEA